MTDRPSKASGLVSGLVDHQAQRPPLESTETARLAEPLRQGQGRAARSMPAAAWRQEPLALALVDVLKDKNAQRH
ncbi:hypothetical protein LPB72_00930 [Hydrogenophaga crassostreae]|uniref:Uncharacterized protein n=1 Tax=Hydrogenophaga crassostreae TaxID=1763535 RepID=A0A162W5T0_9BURK|nr:hypothetical protein LPB072_14885 [Hydrogenophaga crassostreae]OAD44106.1 hypothetical protein LPB72_00930 [Hydrogenophaga crassostreae]